MQSSSNNDTSTDGRLDKKSIDTDTEEGGGEDEEENYYFSFIPPPPHHSNSNPSSNESHNNKLNYPANTEKMVPPDLSCSQRKFSSCYSFSVLTPYHILTHIFNKNITLDVLSILQTIKELWSSPLESRSPQLRFIEELRKIEEHLLVSPGPLDVATSFSLLHLEMLFGPVPKQLHSSLRSSYWFINNLTNIAKQNFLQNHYNECNDQTYDDNTLSSLFHEEISTFLEDAENFIETEHHNNNSQNDNTSIDNNKIQSFLTRVSHVVTAFYGEALTHRISVLAHDELTLYANWALRTSCSVKHTKSLTDVARRQLRALDPLAKTLDVLSIQFRLALSAHRNGILDVDVLKKALLLYSTLQLETYALEQSVIHLIVQVLGNICFSAYDDQDNNNNESSWATWISFGKPLKLLQQRFSAINEKFKFIFNHPSIQSVLIEENVNHHSTQSFYPLLLWSSSSSSSSMPYSFLLRPPLPLPPQNLYKNLRLLKDSNVSFSSQIRQLRSQYTSISSLIEMLTEGIIPPVPPFQFLSMVLDSGGISSPTSTTITEHKAPISEKQQRHQEFQQQPHSAVSMVAAFDSDFTELLAKSRLPPNSSSSCFHRGRPGSNDTKKDNFDHHDRLEQQSDAHLYPVQDDNNNVYPHHRQHRHHSRRSNRKLSNQQGTTPPTSFVDTLQQHDPTTTRQHDTSLNVEDNKESGESIIEPDNIIIPPSKSMEACCFSENASIALNNSSAARMTPSTMINRSRRNGSQNNINNASFLENPPWRATTDTPTAAVWANGNLNNNIPQQQQVYTVQPFDWNGTTQGPTPHNAAITPKCTSPWVPFTANPSFNQNVIPNQYTPFSGIMDATNTANGSIPSIRQTIIPTMGHLQQEQEPNGSNPYRIKSPDQFNANVPIVPTMTTPPPPPTEHHTTFYRHPELGPMRYDWEVDFNELNIEEKIGSGATATVYRATWRGTEVAVKKMTSSLVDTNEMNKFMREIQILLKLRHPNLALLMGASVRSRPYFVVMEYCKGGDLFSLLHLPDSTQHKVNQLSVPQKLKIAMDIAKGMTYLHKSSPQVVHRDLKSLNILLTNIIRSPHDEPHAKITDFGLSQLRCEQSPDTYQTAAVGTFHWMAPEVLISQPYNESVDVYSFGILLYELFSQSIPYSSPPPSSIINNNNNRNISQAQNPVNIALAVCQGHRPDVSRVPRHVPSAVISLMVSCWHQDSRQRPSFERILNALRHIGQTCHRNNT